MRPLPFRPLPRLWSRLGALRRDRRGATMIILGFAMIPMTVAVGMSIDYARAARLQTKVNAIADAAALSAVTTPMMARTSAQACLSANLMFTQQVKGLDGLRLNVLDAGQLSVKVTDTASQAVCGPTTSSTTGTYKRTAVVTWNGTADNIFGGLLGMMRSPIGGTSTATASKGSYIDVHVVLDTSQSMGLAASDADAAALYQRTVKYNNDGCTFGCHVAQNGHPYANEALAEGGSFGAPIKLRVNTLRNATSEMLQTAMDSQGARDTYQFGLYRIGRTLTTVPGGDLTPNLASLKTIVSGLKLGPNDSSGYGDTNLVDTMNVMFDKITARGDGSSRSAARAFLIIVTDGVTDLRNDQASATAPGPNYNGCTYNHCTRPIDPATCTRYKNAGITVAVVYTSYLPVKSDPMNAKSTALRAEYTNLIQKMTWPGYTSANKSDNSADIAPALQACASQNWFFEGSDDASITTAMRQLFDQVTKTATITR